MTTGQVVSTREIEVPEGEPLVSKTDLKGVITFVNHVFAAISGYSEQELIGAPHSLVRHPDMPAAAFNDLWKTIKAGRPWDGLVKNRAKNGDYYWVRANVSPHIEAGQIVGYISIRSRATAAERQEAERAYAAMRAGTGGGLTLRDGHLLRVRRFSSLSEVWNSILGRLLAASAAILLLLASAGLLGYAGLAASNERLATLHQADLRAVEQLRSAQDRLRDGRAKLAQVVVGMSRGAAPADTEPAIRETINKAASLWKAWRAEQPSADLLAGGQRVDKAVDALKAGLEPALAAVARGDAQEVAKLFTGVLPPLFSAVLAANDELITEQVKHSRVGYNRATELLHHGMLVISVIVAVGLAVVGALGWQLIRVVRGSARQVEAECRAIACGHLSGTGLVNVPREFRGVASMLQFMRAHLRFAAWERSDWDQRSDAVRHETVRLMADTIETEAGGAVNRVLECSTIMTGDAETMADAAGRMETNAGAVTGAANQAMGSAQSITAATEALATEMRSTADKVAAASELAHRSSARGDQARETIGSLSEVAGRIGTVVALISDIAARTNLLALNATIEASRAGEAGKGFAVVAGEVKNLANQTARATEEVSRQINALRQETSNSVAIVSEIGETMRELASASLEVASAIERQSTSTHEIARSVAESSAAVQIVTTRISEVSAEAVMVGQQTGALRSTAQRVAGEVDALRQALISTVRKATASASRRAEDRIPVEASCRVEISGQAFAGRLVNLSRGGAEIVVNDASLTYGTVGRLLLGSDGRAASGFTVRSADPRGRVHVQFSRGEATPDFPRQIEMLLRAGEPREVSAGQRAAA